MDHHDQHADEGEKKHHHSLHLPDSLSNLIPSFLRKHHDDDKHHNNNDSSHGPSSQHHHAQQQQAPAAAPAQQQQQQATTTSATKKVVIAEDHRGGGGGGAAAPTTTVQQPPTLVEFVEGDRWVVKGEPWTVPTRFHLETYLGGGSYGSVARARDEKTGQLVAVKKIINAFKGQTHALRVLREIAILRRLHHPYIIRLVDVVDPPPPSPARIKDLYVIFEYGGTDLQQLAKMSMTLNTTQIQSILKQLLYAVGYLHDAQVIHRDLKPANVLINPDTLDIRLADFGLARVLLPGKSHGRIREDADLHPSETVKEEAPPSLKRVYTEHVVTRWYRAPEVILSHGLYSTAIDVWSVGCIFAELLGLQNAQGKRRPLFPGRSCFPLSPTQRDDCYRDQRDQLNVIFNVIGTPDAAGIKSLDATEDVVAYLESLPKVEPAELSDIYPHADKSACEILMALIHFDATRRMSIKEALNHPFVRDAAPHIQQPPSVAQAMLRMDIEHRADKHDMIKSLENLLRTEINRMHTQETEDTVDDSGEDDGSGDFARFVRVHSGDITSLSV